MYNHKEVKSGAKKLCRRIMKPKFRLAANRETPADMAARQKRKNLKCDESLSISQEPIKRHTYAPLFLAVLKL